MRAPVVSVCVVIALAVLAIVMVRYANAHCFDYPDGRRCSTSGDAAIGGSVVAAIGAVVAGGRAAWLVLRHG